MKVKDGKLSEVKNKDLQLLEKNPQKFWKKVEKIGCYAFTACTELKTLVVPGTVKQIDDIAFFKCKNLESLILPRGLKRLGYKAFAGCESLKKITIPAGIYNIYPDLFDGCKNLGEVEIENVDNLLPHVLKDMLGGFEFDSFTRCGNNVIFTKSLENNIEEENE